MAAQPGQHMMAVLPDGLGHDQRRVGMDVLEDLHPHALAGDEAVAGGGVVGVGAPHGHAGAGECVADLALHLFLRWPADLIGGQAQIAAGDQQRLMRAERLRFRDRGQWVRHRSEILLAYFFDAPVAKATAVGSS